MKEEIWKTIEGYAGLYEISNLGNVRSMDRVVWNGKVHCIKKGKVLKKSKTTTGYWKIELSKDQKKRSFKVHRLVAIEFIENPYNKPFVNHIDGDPLNNNVANLEWCTQSENIKHAYKIGLMKTPLTGKEDEIIKRYTEDKNSTVRGLAREFNCSHTAVKRLLKINDITTRTLSEARNKYKIDRSELIKDFEKGMSNKELSNKYKTNSALIATYKYKHKKGELL